jgi:hypothetical protein
MRVHSSLTVFILLAGLMGSADAGKLAGVQMADTVEVDGKQLRLNGMGLREATVLNVNVYVAGLYLENVSSDPRAIVQSNQSKVLVLHFVRDVDRDDIVKAWNTGFKNNATVALSAIRPHIDQLNRWMPAFSKGDTLVFKYDGSGVEVAVNGAVKGTITDQDFARSLFAVWLGSKPPNKGLKTGLLGNHRPSA